MVKRFKKPDYILALIVFGLVILGLIMIYSSSIVKSYQITNGQSNYYFLVKQLIAVGIGFVVWLVFYSLDYNLWKKWSIYILILCVVLLVIVLIPEMSKTTGGAQRWINLRIFSFQPSEVAKLGLIIYLASWLDNRKEKVADFWRSFLPFIIILGVILVLIMKEPDFSTAVIIGITALIMYFMAGINLWHLLLTVPVIGVVIWYFVLREPYRWARIVAFLNPKADVLGVSYHIHQTLIAIGSGGLFGLGFGNSKQKYNYLPEAHTDSIFAIICEELGFIRAIFVIIAFVLLALRGLRISKEAPNNFGRLLSFGIITWFISQAFINLAAMLGMVPFSGIPLPFVSFGGSSLIISLAAVGILLNISKQKT